MFGAGVKLLLTASQARGLRSESVYTSVSEGKGLVI